MMAHVALCLAIAVATAGVAHAEVTVEPGVPFTASELASALALRGAAATDVVVAMVSPTAAELHTAVGGQRIELGAARGPAAARLVALQLAMLQLATRGISPEAAGAATAVAEAPADADWTLGLGAGGGHGAAAVDFALIALRADALHSRGSLRYGASVTWLHGLARSPDASALAAAGIAMPAAPDVATADLGIARAAVGLGNRWLSMVAGPELVGYRVSRASPGMTAGIGGGVRARLVGAARWQAIAGADIDAFRHRVIVARDAIEFAATPRVALTALVGLVWSP
jgi:hypothetical protein